MYIESSDLQAAIPPDEFVELTDRTNDPPTTPDDAIVGAAIEAAAGRLHMYVARRYSLPLDATDTILLGFIRRILIDYAWQALHPRADMVPANLADRCDAHDKTLQDIRDGNADLPSSAPPPAASADDKITAASGGRKFHGLP